MNPRYNAEAMFRMIKCEIENKPENRIRKLERSVKELENQQANSSIIDLIRSIFKSKS